MEAYCRRRWGSSSWTQHLRREGRKDGAAFAKWQWWPHTLRGHQWIQYGRERHGLSTDRLNQILFTALYEEGANLSSVDELVALGSQHFGCTAEEEEELRLYLQENQGADQVRKEIENGRRKYRISGVPFYLASRKGSAKSPYAFSGAQPSSSLLKIFAELASEE